jgi:hypothetical protein
MVIMVPIMIYNPLKQSLKCNCSRGGGGQVIGSQRVTAAERQQQRDSSSSSRHHSTKLYDTQQDQHCGLYISIIILII